MPKLSTSICLFLVIQARTIFLKFKSGRVGNTVSCCVTRITLSFEQQRATILHSQIGSLQVVIRFVELWLKIGFENDSEFCYKGMVMPLQESFFCLSNLITFLKRKIHFTKFSTKEEYRKKTRGDNCKFLASSEKEIVQKRHYFVFSKKGIRSIHF